MRRDRQYHNAINANTAKSANKINAARPYENDTSNFRFVKRDPGAASRNVVNGLRIELSKVLCVTMHTGIAYWR